MYQLDLIQTLALAGIFLYIGYFLCNKIKLLNRYNIPAPVVGGLLISVFNLITYQLELETIKFDITLREPLMIAFFTAIGLNASISLLKIGGPSVFKFFIAATIFAVVQNIAGIIVALPFGINPLVGVLSGSVTLTGGPATGLAFAPLFEQHGITGAATIAVASAMVGISSGGIIGGPLGTYLIKKHNLRTTKNNSKNLRNIIEMEKLNKDDPANNGGLVEEDVQYARMLKAIVIILLCMWIGGGVSAIFNSWGLTLPSYIGSMIIAALIRNFDDFTSILQLPHKTINQLGDIALSLFIVLALMTLNLWLIADLAVPLLTILFVQVILTTIICIYPIFPMMGKDYESAVISSGFLGFMLGTTANSMANMKVLAEKFGPAPKAFLIVPIVGAFFIDFTNALIITMFLNIF